MAYYLRAMRREDLDIERIVEVMQLHGVISVEYYLDTQTGDIVAIPEEIFVAIEDGEESSLRAAHRALVETARQIYEGTGRFVSVPRLSEGDIYSVLSHLYSKLKDELKDLETASCLAGVLAGDDFIAGFEEMCITHPEITEMFNQLLDEYTERIARMWLDKVGIKT